VLHHVAQSICVGNDNNATPHKHVTVKCGTVLIIFVPFCAQYSSAMNETAKMDVGAIACNN